MNRITASSAFMLSLFLLILFLAGTTFHFFNEMNSKYVLIQSGGEPVRRIMDPYKFHQNKKGLIFSLTFLMAGTSFLIMVLLPSSEKEKAIARKVSAPEPVASPVDLPGEPETLASSTAAAMEDLDEQEAPPQPQQQSDTLLAAAAATEEDVEEVDLLDDSEGFSEDELEQITEGEDDVVYGTNEITSAAVMDFVHKFPDSALKFLYRKQLNGKPLNKEDEEIYASWEKRGMSRTRVKRYILALMEWEKLPKEPLYEVWKRLRDHIFDTLH